MARNKTSTIPPSRTLGTSKKRAWRNLRARSREERNNAMVILFTNSLELWLSTQDFHYTTHYFIIMHGRGAYEVPPSVRGHGQLMGAVRKCATFFSGIATDKLSMSQLITPNSCSFKQSQLNPVKKGGHQIVEGSLLKMFSTGERGDKRG